MEGGLGNGRVFTWTEPKGDASTTLFSRGCLGRGLHEVCDILLRERPLRFIPRSKSSWIGKAMSRRRCDGVETWRRGDRISVDSDTVPVRVYTGTG